jgi:hypothetical protein
MPARTNARVPRFSRPAFVREREKASTAMLNGWLAFISIGGWCFTILSIMWLVRSLRHREPALAPIVTTIMFGFVAFSAIPMQTAVLIDTSIAACHGHGPLYRQLLEPRQSIWAVITAHPIGTRRVICRDGTDVTLPVNIEGSHGWPSL